MVYCGSGTETLKSKTFSSNKKILWSTAEAVLRHFLLFLHILQKDSMVYCGSGTET